VPPLPSILHGQTGIKNLEIGATGPGGHQDKAGQGGDHDHRQGDFLAQ
jgi:hypothetical protein